MSLPRLLLSVVMVLGLAGRGAAQRDLRDQFGTKSLETARQLAQAIKLSQAKKHKEALTAVEAAVQADPRCQMAHFWHGLILANLGEIPESMVDEVDKRVRILGLRRMEVDVRGLGAFPDARRPRVVWAGVSPHDLASVSSSGQQVVDALEGIGEADERGFHPHITVARVRSPRNLEALAAMLRDCSTRDFGRTPITALKLKASTLTPTGPTYRDIKEYALQ